LTDFAPFQWDRRREQAAQEVAENRLTDEEIARNAGITRMGLHKWRQHTAFAARVEEHRAEYRKIVRSSGIAVLENRVAALDDRWRRMKDVISSRATRYANFEGTGLVPKEAETGLVVLEETIGRGGKTRKWAVDTPLLAEMRNHEKQAAQELGQWEDRQNVSLDLSKLPDTEIVRRVALTLGGVPAPGPDAEPSTAEAGVVPATPPDD
jgi:hypothetical protein